MENQTPNESKPNLPKAPPDKRTARRKAARNRAYTVQIRLFAFLLTVCCLFGMVLPLRPSISEDENRELTPFPTFSIEGLMDGSFFSQLELWYADTYPGRGLWLDVSDSFKSLYGIREEQIVGGTMDDSPIPEVSVNSDDNSWLRPVISDSTEKNPPMPSESDGPAVSTTDRPQTSESTSPTPTTDPSENRPPITTQPTVKPPFSEPEPDDVFEKVDGYYLKGDTAYELYGFSEKNTKRYIAAMDGLAQRLQGKANVYSVIAPLAYGIKLNAATQKSLRMTDQEQALLYIYSSMSNLVKKVYCYPNLLAHKDEYLYFRTDHHWTALGAYYAYQVFCSIKGIPSHPLSYFETMTFDGFLGTMYNYCNKPPAMESNPDTITAYVPRGTNIMNFWESKSAKPTKWNVVHNVSSYGRGVKYSCFIGGDNPYSEIHNTAITDGSACVVVKNSFGNAFVPFTVDHYEYVYVVDLRYYDTWSASYNGGKTFCQLVEEKNITDILVVTNIIATGSSGMLTCLERLFSK